MGLQVGLVEGRQLYIDITIIMRILRIAPKIFVYNNGIT
jgi:hypothetical protein